MPAREVDVRREVLICLLREPMTSYTLRTHIRVGGSRLKSVLAELGERRRVAQNSADKKWTLTKEGLEAAAAAHKAKKADEEYRRYLGYAPEIAGADGVAVF